MKFCWDSDAWLHGCTTTVEMFKKWWSTGGKSLAAVVLVSSAGGLCLSCGPYALTFQIGSIWSADWLLVRGAKWKPGKKLSAVLQPRSPAAPLDLLGGCWWSPGRCLQSASLLVKLTQEILARRRPLDSKPGYSIWWAATPGVQRNALMHAYLPRTPSTALLKQIYPSYLIRKEPLRFCCCLNGSRFPPHNRGFFIFNRWNDPFLWLKQSDAVQPCRT